MKDGLGVLERGIRLDRPERARPTFLRPGDDIVGGGYPKSGSAGWRDLLHLWQILKRVTKYPPRYRSALSGISAGKMDYL